MAGACSRFGRAQLFAKVGWQDGKSDIDISITHAQSDLTATGSAGSFYATDPRQAYRTFDQSSSLVSSASR